MYGNLAGLTRSIGGLVGGIVEQVYEADRVSEVNRQLAYLEQSYQEYNQGLDQQMFDARAEELSSMRHSMSTGSVVKKPFGQATLADIEADEDKFFQKQLEYITKNTTNKKARQEMIQHLTMKNIQNKGIIAGKWHVAADDEARAGLIVHNNTVLASNDPWEVKVQKISTRVNQMVSVGRLRRSEGENIIAEATAASQYSFAHNGAMTMMKETGNPAAGEAWLKENTPFYDGNPDVREKVLSDVRQEFEYFAKTHDEDLDVDLADLYGRADDLDKVEAGLAFARQIKMYDGDKKLSWIKTFQQQRDYMENRQVLPKEAGTALDDAMKHTADLTALAIAESIYNGEPISVQKGILDSQTYAEGGSTILPKDSVDMLEGINRQQPAGLKFALARIKEKGFSLEKKADLGVKMMKFSKQFPDATPEEYLEAVENFIKPVKDRVLNAAWSGTWEVVAETLKADKRHKSNAEKMTEDIQGNLFRGLTEERQEDLLLYSAWMLRMGKQRYPNRNFMAVSPDITGDVTGHPGAAVLIDKQANQYFFKMEKNEFVLYGYFGTRGNRMDKSWTLVGLPVDTTKKAKTDVPIVNWRTLR